MSCLCTGSVTAGHPAPDCLNFSRKERTSHGRLFIDLERETVNLAPALLAGITAPIRRL